jgi:hypothetical protein
VSLEKVGAGITWLGTTVSALTLQLKNIETTYILIAQSFHKIAERMTYLEFNNSNYKPYAIQQVFVSFCPLPPKR